MLTVFPCHGHKNIVHFFSIIEVVAVDTFLVDIYPTHYESELVIGPLSFSMWFYPHQPLINPRQKKKKKEGGGKIKSFTNKYPLKDVLQIEVPKKINQELFSEFIKVVIFKERNDS